MTRSAPALPALVALAAAVLGLALGAGPAAAGGFTSGNFAAWIDLRAGTDGKPVYWYATGHVMDNVTGEVVSRIDGVDVALAFRDPSKPDTWVQLSRKIFILLDPKTGQRQLGPDGKARRATAYPYQVKTYTLRGDEIVYSVESHDSARAFSEPARTNYIARELGGVTHYNYAMFIDRVRVDGQRSQRFEVNDFFLRAGRDLADPERYQYTWVGTGPGPVVSSVLSWRYRSFDAMPGEALKAFIRSEAPLWLAPPKDLAEIAALRAQQPWKPAGVAQSPRP